MQEFFTPEIIGNVSRFVALVASVIAIYKTFAEVVSKKKEKLRADYDFAEKFIADDKWRTLHDYLLERGYWGLSGRQLEASVIRHFLSQTDPLNQLSDYTRGLQYLLPERDQNKKVVGVSMKEPLNNESKFKRKRRLAFIGYVVFAFLGVGPIVAVSTVLAQGLSVIISAILWVFAFSMLAFLNLIEIWSLDSAKRIAKPNVSNSNTIP